MKPDRTPVAPSTTLSARYIDLMTDGVPPAELRGRGDKAVDNALMMTALSAVGIGMGEQDWLSLVLDSRRKLGQQAKVTKGRERTRVEYSQYLTRVWMRATEQGRPVALRDRERYREEARRVVAQWDEFLPRLLVESDWVDAHIIAALLDRIAEVESPRVAFARRDLQEVTGVPERQLRTRLAALEKQGVVRLEVRGRSGGPRAQKRMANVYSLSAPERAFPMSGSATSATSCR